MLDQYLFNARSAFMHCITSQLQELWVITCYTCHTLIHLYKTLTLFSGNCTCASPILSGVLLSKGVLLKVMPATPSFIALQQKAKTNVNFQQNMDTKRTFI